jgi:phosphatidate cytidylyltransferase|tara:strand:- start:14 stop:664 length:651 start_codon:yes stop_codon:yes gene_type:complete
MKVELKKRIITSFFLLLLLILMFNYYFILFISIIIIGIISWIEFYTLISKIYKKKTIKEKIYRFIGKGISLIYLSYVIFLLTLNTDLKIYIYFSILISIFTDLGGFIIGKLFKGKKLTKISPNKTISGAVGSFCFSLLLIPFFIEKLINLNIYSLLFFTILISTTSQLGDLFISLLKRKAKVKNTSDLLPGHGGFLDRIDGIIFVIPISFLLLNYF